MFLRKFPKSQPLPFYDIEPVLKEDVPAVQSGGWMKKKDKSNGRTTSSKKRSKSSGGVFSNPFKNRVKRSKSGSKCTCSKCTCSDSYVGFDGLLYHMSGKPIIGHDIAPHEPGKPTVTPKSKVWYWVGGAVAVAVGLYLWLK